MNSKKLAVVFAYLKDFFVSMAYMICFFNLNTFLWAALSATALPFLVSALVVTIPLFILAMYGYGILSKDLQKSIDKAENELEKYKNK